MATKTSKPAQKAAEANENDALPPYVEYKSTPLNKVEKGEVKKLTMFVSTVQNLNLYTPHDDGRIVFDKGRYYVDENAHPEIVAFLRNHEANGATGKSKAFFWENEFPEDVRHLQRVSKNYITKERGLIESGGD